MVVGLVIALRRKRDWKMRAFIPSLSIHTSITSSVAVCKNRQVVVMATETSSLCFDIRQHRSGPNYTKKKKCAERSLVARAKRSCDCVRKTQREV